MIPEKRFLNQIQQVLARLMQPLWLLDTEGTVLLPEENRSKINLPEFMEPGMPVAFEGKTFLMIGITPELILCADAQGAADLLGDDDAAEIVDAANNSGCFHIYLLPCVFNVRQTYCLPTAGDYAHFAPP